MQHKVWRWIDNNMQTGFTNWEDLGSLQSSKQILSLVPATQNYYSIQEQLFIRRGAIFRGLNLTNQPNSTNSTVCPMEICKTRVVLPQQQQSMNFNNTSPSSVFHPVPLFR